MVSVASFRKLPAAQDLISQFSLSPTESMLSTTLRVAAATSLVLILLRAVSALYRKLRIARGLAPLSGPKGVFLLGNIPAFIRNRDRIYDFLVRLFCASLHLWIVRHVMMLGGSKYDRKSC